MSKNYWELYCNVMVTWSELAPSLISFSLTYVVSLSIMVNDKNIHLAVVSLFHLVAVYINKFFWFFHEAIHITRMLSKLKENKEYFYFSEYYCKYVTILARFMSLNVNKFCFWKIVLRVFPSKLSKAYKSFFYQHRPLYSYYK